MQTWMLLLGGVIIHVIAMISVFDVYFSSPIVHVNVTHASSRPPPAKRVVFIVADGLRADKLLHVQPPDRRSPAPYIRSICEEKGSWGISHAGVPTATRPGHVAMTAGFYEDPSSVAKDIFHPTTLFDTVFIQARYTWSWDAPLFLGKLAKEHPEKMYSHEFPKSQKYLAGIHPTDMDTWVFDEVTTFLLKARENKTVQRLMHQDKLMFFIHLGGIDHAAYIVRPQSKEYLEHVTFLDTGIQRTVEMFEDFYSNDGKTTYIFTSDHGTNDWGAHADGYPAESHTPLIVWGAGIQARAAERSHAFPDTLSMDSDLQSLRRRDIEQPSMAALMSAAIGIPFPRHAVYPLPDEFFDVSVAERQAMLYANLKQLLANYLAIEKHVFHGPLAFGFRKYQYLNEDKISWLHRKIESLEKEDSYIKATSITRDYIRVISAGLRHYKLYSSIPLRMCITVGFVGWFVVCGLVLIQQQQHLEARKSLHPLNVNTRRLIMKFSGAITLLDIIFLNSQSTPVTHCVQFLLPIPIWTLVIIQWFELDPGIIETLKNQQQLKLMTFLCIGTISMMLWGMHSRLVYGCLLLAFGAFTLFGNEYKFTAQLKVHGLLSTLSCAVLVGRPLHDRPLNYEIVFIGGLFCALLAYQLKRTYPDVSVRLLRYRQYGSKFVYSQILLILLSTLIVYYNSILTSQGIRTPLYIQCTTWILFLMSFVTPFVVDTMVQSRLITVTLGNICQLILLSICQETLYAIFCVWNVYIFVEMELQLTNSMPVPLPRPSGSLPSDFLPETSDATVANGHTSAKHHKHTRSNDIPALMHEPMVTKRGRADRRTPKTTKLDFDNTSYSQPLNAMWLKMDFSCIHDEESQCRHTVTIDDVRRCLTCLVLCFSTFLGAGNLVSVSSFDVAEVFCFMTISDPPKMGPLMVYKLLVLPIILACFFRAVTMVTFTSIKTFSCLLMMVMCSLGLAAFCLVTDVGTWEEIGHALSNHVIVQCACAFIAMQFGISHLLCCVRAL